MSAVPPVFEGSIFGKPLASVLNGAVSGSLTAPSSGTISGESPQESAIAELGNLISSLGSLSAAAQSLPLSPPALPSTTQNQPYRPQTTDYMQFAQDSN